MIGGNVTAVVKVKEPGEKNEIGERIPKWVPKIELFGFLDLISGDSPTTYNAKITDSTHVFICDYVELHNVHSDASQLEINGSTYEVTYIDNPMELNKHLEIFLKYIGGGLNG